MCTLSKSHTQLKKARQARARNQPDARPAHRKGPRRQNLAREAAKAEEVEELLAFPTLVAADACAVAIVVSRRPSGGARLEPLRLLTLAVAVPAARRRRDARAGEGERAPRVKTLVCGVCARVCVAVRWCMCNVHVHVHVHVACGMWHVHVHSCALACCVCMCARGDKGRGARAGVCIYIRPSCGSGAYLGSIIVRMHPGQVASRQSVPSPTDAACLRWP